MRERTLRWMATITAVAGIATGCTGKEKTCPSDQTLVGGNCYSLQSDPRNCGTVGNACGPDQGCLDHVCVDCATSSGACQAEVVVACANLDQVRLLRSDLSLASAPLSTDQLPLSIAPLGGDLFVANSTSSTISTVVVDPPSATRGNGAIAVPSPGPLGDLEFVAAARGFLWVSNAQTNTLTIIDPAARAIVDGVSLPPGPFGANPQGIAFIGTRGYLVLNALDAIGVLDVSTVPGVALRPTTIDLSSLAIPGTKPMPWRALASGTRLYVTLADLDPVTYAPASNGHGRVAVIDTALDPPVATPVDLGSGCLDPSGMAISGTTLWVACGFHAYNSADVAGGALVPVELGPGTPVVGPPIALTTGTQGEQHAAGSIAFCNGRGYAGATESGNVIAFDPVARTVLATALACPPSPPKGSYVSDIACAR